MNYRADVIQEFVCFYFLQDFIDSLPDDSGILRLSDIDEDKKNVLYSPRKAPLEIRKPFEEILDYPYNDMGSHFFFEAKSMEILAAVLRYYFTDPKEGIETGPSVSDIRALEAAARLIEENLDRNITIADLSEMVGLNSHKLTQGFRRQFGSSIYAYRKELRMKKSLQLLCSGSLNVSETALMIGYQNIGHFSSDFRRYYGQTPRDYLKNSLFL
jgi:AraC-like DNA-binding protein